MMKVDKVAPVVNPWHPGKGLQMYVLGMIINPYLGAAPLHRTSPASMPSGGPHTLQGSICQADSVFTDVDSVKSAATDKAGSDAGQQSNTWPAPSFSQSSPAVAVQKPRPVNKANQVRSHRTALLALAPELGH